MCIWTAGGWTGGEWTAVHCAAVVRAVIRVLGGEISATSKERSHRSHLVRFESGNTAIWREEWKCGGFSGGGWSVWKCEEVGSVVDVSGGRVFIWIVSTNLTLLEAYTPPS